LFASVALRLFPLHGQLDAMTAKGRLGQVLQDSSLRSGHVDPPLAMTV
jgi:hypothetical protein